MQTIALGRFAGPGGLAGKPERRLMGSDRGASVGGGLVKRQADIVIIGGGLIGCATAHALAGRGLSVTVLEKGQVGGEQSRRALGFINTLSRDPVAVDLSVAAAKLWCTLPAELEADLEWSNGGYLGVAENERTLASLRQWLEVAARVGVEAREVSTAAISAMLPALRDFGAGGIVVEGDGHAEPLKVPVAYADAARRRGVSILEGCTATGIDVTRGKVTGVRTQYGTIYTSIVVCAAGVWSSRLARTVGLRLPTVTVRGMALETAPMPPLTNLSVMVGGLAFRQRPGGSIYASYVTKSIHDLTLDSFRYVREFLPSRGRSGLMRVRVNRTLLRDAWRSLPGSPAHVPGFDPRRTVQPRSDAAVVRQTVRHLATISQFFADIRVERAWGEPIDITPDDLPIIDAVGEPEGLVFATGLSGHGFTLGPLVGKLVAELIADGKTSMDIRHLRLSRFAQKDYVPAGPRF